jgi:hypothetical protein
VLRGLPRPPLRLRAGNRGELAHPDRHLWRIIGWPAFVCVNEPSFPDDL